MKGSPGEGGEHLESALLFLGRSLAGLAAALRELLAPDRLRELAKAAGRRRPGLPSEAEVVADGLIQQPKFRQQVVQALLTPPPPALEIPEPMLDAARVQFLRTSALRGVILTDLCRPDQAAWERAEARLRLWAARLLAPAAAAAPTPAAARAAKVQPDKGAASRARKLEEEKGSLQDRLRGLQQEVSRLQDEVGRERKRRHGLREELTECSRRVAEAEARAAEAKRRLKETESPAERERLLMAEAKEANARLHVLEQKFAIISEERDDLRACLEDHDRFSKVVEEEVPSFRDRPLTQPESQLAALLAARTATGRSPCRILVVGGGEPQLRHQDKFEEYAEILGIHGRWRMAEYTSWHKEINLLSRDMERNFDALIVLHWNRTTFTRRARDICNQQGQKPCLTRHYAGLG
ncbi:MAG: hypothetical protein H8E31_02040, partial [Planctomycetes bacterium]|nr:hypothetical protein [Planctomycetota bacterium]